MPKIKRWGRGWNMGINYKEDFINRFNSKYDGKFKYVGGYTHSEKPFIFECLNCGKLLERSATCVREGHYSIECANCCKVERDNNKVNKGLAREREKQLRKEEKRIKEIKRLTSICNQCGEVFIGTTAEKKYCSNICASKYNNVKKETNRRQKLKDNGKIQWDITLDKLIRRDKNICHICGEKCNKEDYVKSNSCFIAGNDYPSIDHVLAVNNGGTHTWNNVKLAHRLCNTIKRDKVIHIIESEQIMLVM